MLKIGIIMGSTRPNRKSESVARWVFEVAKRRSEAEFELVDLRDYHLPIFDEPMPPARRQYTENYPQEWAKKIGSFDGYIFVTPEYNHGIPGVLKNAIDYVYYEWNDKSAGFVSYGVQGGVRAVEQLRMVMGELHVATVRQHVTFLDFTDFENSTLLKPNERQEKTLNDLISQVIVWGSALKAMREKDSA